MLTEWIFRGLIIGFCALTILAIPLQMGWLSRRGFGLLIGAVSVIAVGIVAQVELWKRAEVKAATAVPTPRQDTLFAGSGACRSCHAKEYDTWHSSYHRTMTQVATPKSVVAPFHDVRLEKYGHSAQLIHNNDEYFVTMADPDLVIAMVRAGENIPSSQLPQVKRQIVMTTGSHLFQAYWYVANDEGELWQFPWRFNISENMWMHRDDVFLQPPSDRPAMGHQIWNAGCINCHSVGGQPGLDKYKGAFAETHIAELGIACESCHGPCSQHVKENRNPLRRYQLHLTSKVDSTVFHPTNHSHQLASQACGSCHSHHEYDKTNPANDHLNTLGREHRPGMEMTERARFLSVHDEKTFTDGEQQIAVSRFWADGACRSGGREYNGLIESPCYLKGTMTCNSCHTMHGQEPDDQLKTDMRSNQACLQCHPNIASNVEAHTHHSAGSSGNDCMNCHMPYTSFALLKGIRSHRIDSPSVTAFGENVRLNACNLCHLDQSLNWASDHLTNWYSQPRPDLPDDSKNISAALNWMLSGDAGQRVISAWHFGWEPATTNTDVTLWGQPFLAELLRDPYAAVRFNAASALERISSVRRSSLLDISVNADPDTLRLEASKIISDWTGKAAAISANPRPLTDFNLHKKRIGNRNDRPMVIVE